MQLPDGWTTARVHTNGVTLQCYTSGDGPPIVLAHGAYDSGLRWLPLVDHLSSEYELIAFDARGHGYSDAPDAGYSIGDRVADLRGVVDALELTDPVLLGHSMGAGTVAWAAATYPELPGSAVLVEPMELYERPDSDPETRAENARTHARQFTANSVAEVAASDHGNLDPGHARRLAHARLQCDPTALAELAREGYPEPLASVFPDITCPTLVLRADVDTDERSRDTEAIEQLSDGRIAFVSGAGHHVFCDAFDGAMAELESFLERS